MTFTRLLGPEVLRLSTGQYVESRNDYVVWLGEMLAALDREQGISASPHRHPGKVAARIEHGRYVVDCPCGSAALTRPDWTLACCAHCGAMFDQIVFPSDIASIESVILRRPKRQHQNWIPSESVSDLEAQNRRHGVN